MGEVTSRAKKQAYKDMQDSGVDTSYIDHEKDILSYINGGEEPAKKKYDMRTMNKFPIKKKVLKEYFSIIDKGDQAVYGGDYTLEGALQQAKEIYSTSGAFTIEDSDGNVVYDSDPGTNYQFENVKKLSRNDLRKIVTECVKKIIQETTLDYDMDNFSGKWNRGTRYDIYIGDSLMYSDVPEETVDRLWDEIERKAEMWGEKPRCVER